MKNARRIRHAAALAALVAATTAAHAAGVVGNTLPPGFPSIEDTSLARPLIGFGAAGPVTRTPVIFIHGNNDTPFPTACNPYGRVQALAQYFADNGYAPSELWGVGYQGDQCDLAGDQTRGSSIAHTNAANVPDLRRFIRAVMDFTGFQQEYVPRRAAMAYSPAIELLHTLLGNVNQEAVVPVRVVGMSDEMRADRLDAGVGVLLEVDPVAHGGVPWQKSLP